jgi:hypothetical protein
MDVAIQQDGSLVATRVSVLSTETTTLTVVSGPLITVSSGVPVTHVVEAAQQGYLPAQLVDLAPPVSATHSSRRRINSKTWRPPLHCGFQFRNDGAWTERNRNDTSDGQHVRPRILSADYYDAAAANDQRHDQCGFQRGRLHHIHCNACAIRPIPAIRRAAGADDAADSSEHGSGLRRQQHADAQPEFGRRGQYLPLLRVGIQRQRDPADGLRTD